jgi:two-component system sensor histidine kinase TctE
MGPLGPERPGGLFAQVLDWMLAPLVFIWPIAVIATYFAATGITGQSFDRELRDMVRAVSEEAASGQRDARGERSLPVLNALRNDPVDRLFVQVMDVDGRTIAGDANLPGLAPGDPAPGLAIQFRDVRLDGEKLRVGYGLVPVPGGGPALVVHVGESLRHRHELVNELTAIVMMVTMLLVPITVAMVWFGLKRGLRPLQRLRQRVEGRDPDDLSPIPTEEVPQEVAPLVNTLNRQLERVRRNLEAQRRFVADAAHQMRTPLAGLKTQAQAALRGDSLQSALPRLAQIEESADRLSRLVAQLLSLARADDASMQAAAREPVDLNALLREVCEASADRAVAKRVGLGFDPAEAPVAVPAAPLLLRELFANLLDNAIRYTPEGGDVAVRVHAGTGPAVVVEDTGCGIALGERDHVFDRFYRVLGSGEAGSGLGLSIVKAIADLHSATVHVESGARGVGTRFVVTFPA